MASNYTTNYQLNQWEAGDQVLRTEFNQDNQKIDTALKTITDAIAANGAAIAEQAIAIAKCGTCKFTYFSYTGQGRVQNTLTFPKKPLLFFILGDASFLCAGPDGGRAVTVLQGIETYVQSHTVTWNGNQVVLSGSNSSYQMDEYGDTYHVYGLYADTE